MLRLLPLLPLLALLCAAAPARSDEAHFLIGGENSTAPPWMAALLRSGYRDPYTGQFCGATLIAPDWALTAAHCLHPELSGFTALADVTLLAGTAELREGGGERVGIAQVILHPAFVLPGSSTGIEFDNDLALLRLEHPLALTPVELPAPEFDLMHEPAGTPLRLFGWGARAWQDEMPNDYPRRLQSVELPLVNGPDCLRVMGSGEVSANMLCAGHPLTVGDSCVGDSGGPLALPAATASGWRQLGVISWGLGCGLPDTYGVYTRLARYSQWISERICAPHERPAAPRIESLEAVDGQVRLRFTSGHPGARHRIYYRPAATRSPVRHIELGSATDYATAAPAGVAYEVAVQSHVGNCQGAFSEILSFQL